MSDNSIVPNGPKLSSQYMEVLRGLLPNVRVVAVEAETNRFTITYRLMTLVKELVTGNETYYTDLDGVVGERNEDLTNMGLFQLWLEKHILEVVLDGGLLTNPQGGTATLTLGKSSGGMAPRLRTDDRNWHRLVLEVTMVITFAPTPDSGLSTKVVGPRESSD